MTNPEAFSWFACRKMLLGHFHNRCDQHFAHFQQQQKKNPTHRTMSVSFLLPQTGEDVEFELQGGGAATPRLLQRERLDEN